MRSGPAPTAFDVVLFMVIIAAAVLWAIASSPGLDGLTAVFVLVTLVVVVLLMVAATAWGFVSITHRLSGHYEAMIQGILRNRRDVLPAKWRANHVGRIKGLVRDLGSALLFFLAFLAYFSVMIVFFYGLGGQPFADPSRLMIPAFLGTSVVHFSGRGEVRKAVTVVLDFLVPFGIIVGLIDLTVIGPHTLLSWGSKYAPIVLAFFAAYYGLDVAMERRSGGTERHKPGEHRLA